MSFRRRQTVDPHCRHYPLRHLLTVPWASIPYRFPHPHGNHDPRISHLPRPCVGVPERERRSLPPCANHSTCHPPPAHALRLFNMLLRISPLHPHPERVSQLFRHQSRCRGLWSSRPLSSRPATTKSPCALARLCASSESSTTNGAWCRLSVALQ